MIERQVSLDRKSHLLSHLQNIVSIAEDKNANIVVVGGIALRASMNKPVEFCRPNGTIPDIDMVGLGPTPMVLTRTKKEIDYYRKKNPSCPSVSLEPVEFSEFPSKFYKPWEFLSGLRRDQHGEYYLTFRSIDQAIPYQTMDVFIRRYGSIAIPTLAQETTLHRYGIRTGFIKPKDQEKIKEFKEYIDKNGGDGLDPKLYESYFIFCQKINQQHSSVVKLSKYFWDFDYKHNGKISGSSGFIYDLIRLIRR